MRMIIVRYYNHVTYRGMHDSVSNRDRFVNRSVSLRWQCSMADAGSPIPTSRSTAHSTLYRLC
jgi:hypothetical protein